MGWRPWSTAFGPPGVNVVDDEPLEGFTRVYVNDPFGNRIELLEPVRSS
jgi:hypothetical protein